jgi:hypothetical protein
LLQKIRFLAKNISSDQRDRKFFDENTLPHSFQINDLVWYEDFTPLGKNPKLTPKWQGPAKNTEINDTNAHILLSKGKTEILNIMCIKKFFPPSPNSETVSENNDLNFKSIPKITGLITRAMKKLLEQQKATEMVINVLCDLSKKHYSMCKWEQECSDNRLLFDPAFAHQYIKECKSWPINKQSMCAKCKFQLGEHLIDHQAENSTNNNPISNNASISRQCQHFQSDPAQYLINPFPFQELNSQESIKLQNALHESDKTNQNLIKNEAQTHTHIPNDEIF